MQVHKPKSDRNVLASEDDDFDWDDEEGFTPEIMLEMEGQGYWRWLKRCLKWAEKGCDKEKAINHKKVYGSVEKWDVDEE
jgi:hypothetical protein